MQTAEIRWLNRRTSRLGASSVRSGLVTPEGTASLAAVGFVPVSEVMGAVAMRAPVSGFFQIGEIGQNYPRGWQGGPDTPPRVYTSSTHSRVPARVTAMKDGYRTALRRLIDETRTVGGDGAIGVRVVHAVDKSLDGMGWQFLATGTAVRSVGTVRASAPFTAALTAAQTAAALRGGWAPVRYLACPVMAVRWVEPESRRQERLRSPNAEVTAFTETVNACRHQARTDFARAAAAAGGDGAVMTSMDVHVGPAPDLAEVFASVIGTAITRFGAPSRPAALPIVTLDYRT